MRTDTNMGPSVEDSSTCAQTFSFPIPRVYHVLCPLFLLCLVMLSICFLKPWAQNTLLYTSILVIHRKRWENNNRSQTIQHHNFTCILSLEFMTEMYLSVHRLFQMWRHGNSCSWTSLLQTVHLVDKLWPGAMLQMFTHVDVKSPEGQFSGSRQYLS